MFYKNEDFQFLNEMWARSRVNRDGEKGKKATTTKVITSKRERGRGRGGEGEGEGERERERERGRKGERREKRGEKRVGG